MKFGAHTTIFPLSAEHNLRAAKNEFLLDVTPLRLVTIHLSRSTTYALRLKGRE